MACPYGMEKNLKRKCIILAEGVKVDLSYVKDIELFTVTGKSARELADTDKRQTSDIP